MIIQDGNNDEFIAIDTRVVHNNISNHFYKKNNNGILTYFTSLESMGKKHSSIILL